MRISGSRWYKDTVVSWLPSSPCGCFLTLQVVADLSASAGNDPPKDAGVLLQGTHQQGAPQDFPALLPDAEGGE